MRRAVQTVAVSVAAVVAMSCAMVGAPVHTFTIVHLNDVYEIFPVFRRVGDRYEPRGGLAHLATLLREARRRGPVLVLHAGDFLSPSLLSIRFNHRGAQMIEAMNAMDVDVATFGNHEFDFGCRILLDRIERSRFSWVAANVQVPAPLSSSGKVVPYRIVTIAGLHVGVFGLTLPLSPIPCDRDAITFRDPLTTAKAMVAALKREGVQLIVALTHLPMADDRALAAAVPDIDVIVGGHDHDMMSDQVGKTLIAKADANATAVGLIRLTAARVNGRWIVEKSWTRQEVNPRAVDPDEAASRALAPYAAELGSLSKPIGSTETPLDVREHVVREAESNFGNYIADLIRAETRADVAIINGGALRGDRVVPAGPLTLEDLATALVYQDRIVTVTLSGAELIQVLENGVSRAGQRDGRFPQVAGLALTFDPDGPSGQRVLRVAVGGAPLEPKRTYTLGTISFLAKPGNMDGYSLPAAVVVGGDLTEMVVRNLAKGPIKPTIDGRIISLRQPR